MKNKIKILLGITTLIIIVASFSFNSILKKSIEEVTSKNLGVDTSISSLIVNPFNGTIKSSNIVLSRDNTTLLTLDSFTFASSIPKILQGEIIISEITLNKPAINIDGFQELKATTDNKEEKKNSSKEKTIKDSSEPFIKKVSISNVNLNELSIISKSTTLKSLSSITLAVPKFNYESDIIDIDAKLEVIGSGHISLVGNVNTQTSNLDINIKTDDLNINNHLNINNRDISISGDLLGDFNIKGNYETLEISLSGAYKGTKINFEEADKQLLSFSIDSSIEEATPKSGILNSIKIYNLYGDIDSLINILEGTSTKATISGDKGSFSKDPSKNKSPFDLLIRSFDLVEGDILIQSQDINNINLKVTNISLDSLKNSNFVASLSVANTGIFDINLNILDLKLDDPINSKFTGSLSATDLNLDSISKLVELPLLLSGNVDLNTYINYNKENIVSRGNINGSKIIAKDNSGLNIAADSIKSSFNATINQDKPSLRDTNITINNLKGSIQKNTSIDIPSAKVSINNLNLTNINLNSLSTTNPTIVSIRDDQKEEVNKDKENKPTKKTKALPSIYIKRVVVTGGKFTDILNTKKTSIDNINFKASNLTSKKNIPFSFDGNGNLVGISGANAKGTLTLLEEWSFDPKKMIFKGEAGISSLHLPMFNPIISQALPNTINSGTLKLAGKFDLNKGLINSLSKVTVSGLSLGEATGKNKEVPLKKVIDTLTDSNGNIRLSVPISGNLNDPNFGIKTIIKDTFSHNLKEALKEPEKVSSIVTGLLTYGKEASDKLVYFDYASTTPKPSELEKLARLKKVLVSDPNKKATLTLYTNKKVEEGILIGKDVLGSLFGGKRKKSSPLDETIKDRVSYITNYFKEEQDQVTIEVSNSTRDLPQIEVKVN